VPVDLTLENTCTQIMHMLKSLSRSIYFDVSGFIDASHRGTENA